MTISIVVPVKGDNKYLRECIEACLNLDYPNFEVIVLPDEAIALPYGDKVRIIPTGHIGPAKKRDMVVDQCRGEILAFLDDDTFPKKDWLKNAISNFDNKEVAAVCGPAVTPENDSLAQKVSGTVFSLSFVSGAYSMRYVPTGSRREVDDFPSCNFLIRKDVFKQIGGFDTNFWPGEDTVLCYKITKELMKKIIYDPGVLVYHHRRPSYDLHLKQVESYALHRGCFVKRFPATSLRFSYFVPTIFVLGLAIGGALAIFMPAMRFLYFGVIGVYLILDLSYSSKNGNRALKFRVFFLNILTHLAYGIYFIKGLLSRKLTEE